METSRFWGAAFWPTATPPQRIRAYLNEEETLAADPSCCYPVIAVRQRLLKGGLQLPKLVPACSSNESFAIT